MVTLTSSESPAPVRAAHEEVGLLSADRWGVGSLFVIGVFLGTGSLFLLRWAGTRGGFSLMLGVLLLGGGAIMFVVRATENIQRVKFRGYDPVGKTGVVTMAMAGRMTGSVRVDGMDWSARSEETIEAGAEVLVVSREGLYVSVKKLHMNPG
ncbi:MAG: NfeD family protein [Nitrososphaerota archaeon]|nr:NfeD family protein [Nitrososphaerota archaeon]MDG7024710.1 NfeD family protein [Nitrososphaerota archaeon]